MPIGVVVPRDSSDERTLLVADGMSCRHQIDDGLGRQALHVASVLEMGLS